MRKARASPLFFHHFCIPFISTLGPSSHRTPGVVNPRTNHDVKDPVEKRGKMNRQEEVRRPENQSNEADGRRSTTSEMDCEIFLPQSPLEVGNRRLAELKNQKEAARSEVNQLRTDIEHLRKQFSSSKARLALEVRKNEDDSLSIQNLNAEKDDILEQIERAKSNALERLKESTLAGHDLQIECIELTNRVASMQLEYKSVQCLENGLKTKAIKSDEQKRMISELEQKIAIMELNVSQAKSVELLDLEHAIELLNHAKSFSNKMDEDSRLLGEEIYDLKGHVSVL